MEINNRNILVWLHSLNVGNDKIRNIQSQLESLKDLWYLKAYEVRNLKGLSKGNIDNILKYRNYDDFSKILERAYNYNVITIFDEAYPKKLKNIPNRPKVLYVEGLPIREDMSMAIVGSRKFTDYGKWACRKFVRELTELDIPIISGLALGIDAIAHSTVLENNGYTIGVLGCGIDLIYPKRNTALYLEMKKVGTIISEFPLGTRPLPHNFPLRNRIISGLSDGVIIVEAKDKSGSLITAEHALEQGRDIFAIPGNINSIFSSGTNKLIRDGAIPLLDMGDIIQEKDELKKKLIDKTKINLEMEDLSTTERKVLREIQEGPVHSDNIVYNTGIDISSINTILIGLELKGYIEEISSNVFMIC